MNILTASWLPFRTHDDSTFYGSPASLADPDVVDLGLSRADFQGAAWQFLVGLLQTTFAPKNVERWQAHWVQAPTCEALAAAFEPWKSAFWLFGDSARFMQDYDPLTDARQASVSSLLIEAPGSQGVKFNTDHFVKRGIGEVMCPACAAMALFTMQINAPSGGKGYRTGVRGGGPLTTLILPQSDNASLWHKLWLNVLPSKQFATSAPQPDDAQLFPWLAPTRVSDKAGSGTVPEDAHPLHVYWAMPRRFRLNIEDDLGRCAVCGQRSEQTVRSVSTTNYGYNYEGSWRHPLTPYRFDTKKPNDPANPLKGQQAGLGYRHWESLVLGDRELKGNLPALVVQDYAKTKRAALEDLDEAPASMRLWAFGYDMDNMKPRGWHATQMPLVTADDDAARDKLLTWIRRFIEPAEKSAYQLRSAVKSAWFSRSGDANGDVSFLDQRFYEDTESDFYACLSELAEALEHGSERLPPATADRWLKSLRGAATRVFDEAVLTGEAEALDMERITAARNRLQRWLYGGKEMKALGTSTVAEAS